MDKIKPGSTDDESDVKRATLTEKPKVKKDKEEPKTETTETKGENENG